MLKTQLVIFCALNLVCTTLSAQNLKGQRCHVGTLLAMDSRTELVPVTSSTHVEEKVKKDKTVYTGTTTPDEQKKTIYTIRVALDGFVYTADSSPVFGVFSYKPTDLVVGDPVEACVKDKDLVVTRPDGKDFKAKITRTARDAESSAAASRPTNEKVAASVQIDSAPAGADIQIDGAFVGSTPSNIQLPSGSHDVAVSKEGFKPWTRTIRVTSGQVSVKADLQKQ